MNKLKLFISTLLLLLCSSTQAVTLTGEAYAPTREDARQQALSALSESVLVEVKSVFESEQSSNGYIDATKKMSSVSELPLLGVDYTVIDKKGEFFCSVLLNGDRSLSLYQAELKKLASSIDALNKKQLSQKANKSQRHKTLDLLLTDLEQYDKHQTVARFLGSNVAAPVSVKQADVRSELLSIEAAAPSVDIVARVLTRDLPVHQYKVQAAMPAGAKRATKLSRLLKDNVERHLQTKQDVVEGEFTLKGSYEILKEGVSVTYRVIDPRGVTTATRVAMLSKAALSNIEYKPASVNFDQLLHEGYVVSNDFKAQLNTSAGKEGLAFTEGETIGLFTKLNSPGYFYLVSHNTSDNISYVLELSESHGKRKFLRYVNADEVNRWLSLGEFEVSAPFGAENLQLIASSKDLIDSLPNTHFDPELELYVVGAKTTEEAVTTTRGLKPKRSNKVKSSEATLTFTTMRK
ncbi:MAG: DUF4384 domain-containing protein [Gammaproteobacteria bacterium]|nr:DUF4384 domain-containing protein [Gammaproteobacteria bacterium]